MTTVHVHRADETRTEPVPAAHIAIDLTQPAHDRDSNYADTAQAMFDADAKAIADTLHAALPGGTLKALMAELLERQVCLLRVPLPGAVRVERPAPVGSWWETPDGAIEVDGDYLDGPVGQIVTFVLHRPDGGRAYGKWGGRELADAYTRLDGPPAWFDRDTSRRLARGVAAMADSAANRLGVEPASKAATPDDKAATVAVWKDPR